MHILVIMIMNSQHENGQEYLVHNTDHDHTFIWDNGKYIFEICSNLDKQSVLELCESTKTN